MNEEESMKIESIYNTKSKKKLLLSFEKKNKTQPKIKISNTGFLIFKKRKKERPKTTINTIKNIIESNFKSKTININNAINNNSDNKTQDYKNVFNKEKEQILKKLNQNSFIKKDNKIYLLRKVFIILPNDKKYMHTKHYPSKLFFNFYFPILLIDSKININYIKNSTRKDIICDDLNHILFEVYKYLNFTIYDPIKMEIYDERFHRIIKPSQLFINIKRIIYVKITVLNDKQKLSWKKKIKSKLFPLDDNYLIRKTDALHNYKIPSLYRDVSTEYNKNDTQNKSKNINKFVIKKWLIKDTTNMSEKKNNIDSKDNYETITLTNNRTNFRTYSNDTKREDDKVTKNHDSNEVYEEQLIDNIMVSSDEKNLLQLKRSCKTLSQYSQKLIKKIMNKKNKSTQNHFSYLNNNIDNESYLYSITNPKSIDNYNFKNRNIILTENTFIKDKKPKVNHNILFNLISSHKTEKARNTLLSPLLFNFNVEDIINNKYILKYLTNKNKQKIEDNIFHIKCNNFKIKHLNNEDSSSHRRKSFNISKKIILSSHLIKESDNMNNEEKEIIKLKIKENEENFCNIIHKIHTFIVNDIDDLLTNEETDDFKSLKCNYILINELKDFPLSKLRKEFLLYACLSRKIKSKYEELLTNINSIMLNKNEEITKIFSLNDFDKLLKYLDELFTNIKNNKMNLFRYIGYTQNNDLKISFIFLILFVFYKKCLVKKNADKNLMFTSFECIEITFDIEINFQKYCDYKILLTKNKYINYNKKFNFIKDFILRILIGEKFNKKKLIERLNIIFDINLNDIKSIFNLDMCSVKLIKNVNVYNKISKLYDSFINYYNY